MIRFKEYLKHGFIEIWQRHFSAQKNCSIRRVDYVCNPEGEKRKGVLSKKSENTVRKMIDRGRH